MERFEVHKAQINCVGKGVPRFDDAPGKKQVRT